MNSAQPWLGRRLHFVGIGGTGMSSLALAAHRLGATVTGSDVDDTSYIPRLRRAGILVTIGHNARNVCRETEIIYSSAVAPDNVERRRGRDFGVREISRGNLLGELAASRRTIAVAGTHGKTTTAAMVIHALGCCGVPPDYLIGGDILSTATNSDVANREWLVIETDESDRSLLALRPEIGVLTNVDHDHVETYGSVKDVAVVFRQFLDNCRWNVVWDRPGVASLGSTSVRRFDATGARALDGGSVFDWRGQTVRVGVPGLHNAANAAACLEVCLLVGVDLETAARSLESFSGVARRFERVGRARSGAVVVDDYGHHPTEIAATIAAARTLSPRGVTVVLRPWGLRRVAAMAEGFAAALAKADAVVLLDTEVGSHDGAVDSAVSSSLIADALGEMCPELPVSWVHDASAARSVAEACSDRDDLIVCFGCTDVAAKLASGSRVGSERSSTLPTVAHAVLPLQ